MSDLQQRKTVVTEAEFEITPAEIGRIADQLVLIGEHLILPGGVKVRLMVSASDLYKLLLTMNREQEDLLTGRSRPA